MRTRMKPLPRGALARVVKHFASPKFWPAYEALPLPLRRLADANFELLKRDPRHSSRQFKKVGRYWSVQSAAAIFTHRPLGFASPGRTFVFRTRCLAGLVRRSASPPRAVLRGFSEEKIMTSKHPKQKKPSDTDLHRNPLIGGSKGTTMAHVKPEELEQLQGAQTIEGDAENA